MALVKINAVIDGNSTSQEAFHNLLPFPTFESAASSPLHLDSVFLIF